MKITILEINVVLSITFYIYALELFYTHTKLSEVTYTHQRISKADCCIVPPP